MPRTPRSEVVDGLCHITARGNRREAIFLTPLDYFEFSLLLGEVVAKTPVTCHGFCLMPNHVHLVLDAEQPAVSSAMHRLLGVYAKRFNRRHGFVGHLFQGRFVAEPIVSEPHLIEVVRSSPSTRSARACARVRRTGPGAATPRTWTGRPDRPF